MFIKYGLAVKVGNEVFVIASRISFYSKTY